MDQPVDQLILEDREKEVQNDEMFPLQSSSHLPDLGLSHATSKLLYELHLGVYLYHSHLHILLSLHRFAHVFGFVAHQE